MMRLQILLCVAIGFAFGFVLGIAAVNAAPLEPLGTTLDPMKDYRYCGDPKRTDAGKIARSKEVIAAFKRTVPCPSTGKTSGACPGWSDDHVWPLAKGGCDAVFNMQWLPNSIKSCAKPDCKDRFERKVYGNPHGIVKLP